MIVSIHQPDYIPYLGYFYKMAKADAFVFLDDVQFSSSNMHNWNTILDNGKEQRLKIPVEYRFGDTLNHVRCKYELGWVEKHLKLIKESYAAAPFFAEVYPVFEEILNRQFDSLAALNICLNSAIAGKMGITASLTTSSDMVKSGKKEDLVIDICRQLGADAYLSGNGARNYQSEEDFTQNGLQLIYTGYAPFPYRQTGNDFLPNLSVLDFLMNCGWTNPF